jgi:tetratricopeptide (TPR) repeat protein
MRSLLFVMNLLFVAACGTGGAEGSGNLGSIEVPDRITDGNFLEYARTYHGLQVDDGSRAPLRDRLLTYLEGRTEEPIATDDYDAVVAEFAMMTDFYSPADFSRGELSRALEAPARYIAEQGARRGDEGRVLSAYLVLRAATRDAVWDRRYREVADWGRDARSELQNPLERFAGLLDVWEEHARLTPLPEVLEYVARLHLERRDAVVALLQREGPALAFDPSMRMAPAILRVAPLDVAAVFLRVGDVASALSHVEALGDSDNMERELIRVLRATRDGDEDALVELAQAYGERRPDVALGLCRAGLRQNPEDARFPLCLARVHAASEQYPVATGWYAEAIRLAPDEREVYDEALDALGMFLGRGIYDSDPSEARGLAHAAEEILRERLERWPSSPPSVTPEQLHYVVGLLELNAGNAQEAERRFEASVDAQETADAQLELGRIAEGTNRAREAVQHYRRALDLTPGEGPAGARARARILEFLGNAYRKSDEDQQGDRMFQQALDLWSTLTIDQNPALAAEAHVRRGILLDRLDRRTEALTAFRQAMEAAPNEREIYASILSHLVISSPDPAFATEVFNRALRELTVEPEWKVYFALWLETIAARAGATAPNDATAVLRSHSSGEDWHGRLARFGVGELQFGDLLAHAQSVGERAEAHFYEGARRLRSGDAAGARAEFQAVLESNMVNFYEYIMALEFLTE